MRMLALAVVYVGLPGFLVGLALGLVIRRWAVLLLVGALGAIAVRYGLQRIDRGSSGDNDPRIIVMLALTMNFAGSVVGGVCGRFLAGRADPSVDEAQL